MKKYKSKARNALPFRRDESGATAVEYALIGGLIFLGIVGAVGAYTDSTSSMYESVETALDDAHN